MPRIIKSPEAEQDLLDIWLYIADDNEVAADELLSNLEEKALLLLKHPELGRKREDLATELRSIPEGRYVIFYRIEGHNIEIVRILHSSRDVENIISDV